MSCLASCSGSTQIANNQVQTNDPIKPTDCLSLQHFLKIKCLLAYQTALKSTQSNLDSKNQFKQSPYLILLQSHYIYKHKSQTPILQKSSFLISHLVSSHQKSKEALASFEADLILQLLPKGRLMFFEKYQSKSGDLKLVDRKERAGWHELQWQAGESIYIEIEEEWEMSNAFWKKIPVFNLVPILLFETVVNLPKSEKIQSIAKGLKHQFSQNAINQTHTWTQSWILPEQGSYLYLSSFESWHQVAKTLSKFYFHDDVCDQMNRGQLGLLFQSEHSLPKIFKAFQQNFSYHKQIKSYQSIKHPLEPYIPRKIDQIIKQKSGDCRDLTQMSILYFQCLKKDFELKIFLTNDRFMPNIAQNFVSLDWFNHILLVLESKQSNGQTERFYFDLTATQINDERIVDQNGLLIDRNGRWEWIGD